MKARALVPLLVAAPALLALSPAPARGSSQPPTAAQIRAAVRRGESSRDLWTTINICNTKDHPLTLGIRGQMPALGFQSSLEMDVQALYWSAGRFIPVPRTQQLMDLGAHTTGLYQKGVSFSFAPAAGRLSGTITFIWRRAGKVLAKATRAATGGHPSADDGDPKHYSSAQCAIP